MDDEKEVINGYAVDSSIWIGTKRVCFGIAEDHKEEYPYMVCVYESEGYLFPMCDKMMCYDEFTEALTAYANKISEYARELVERRTSIEVDDLSCLKEDDVVSGSPSKKWTIRKKNAIIGNRQKGKKKWEAKNKIRTQRNSRKQS